MANQTSGKDGKGRELVCSFCGRTQNEVEQLIIGPGVNICKDCLDMCNNALYKDGERPAPPRAGMPRNRRRTDAQPGADYDYDPLESINILTPAEIKAGLAAQALAPLVQPVGKHKAGRPKLRPVRQALVFRKLGHGLPQGFHVGGAFQRPVPPAGVYRQKRLPAPLRKGRILRFVHRFPSLPGRRVRRGIISHVYDLYRRRRKGSTKGYGAPAGIIDP